MLREITSQSLLLDGNIETRNMVMTGEVHPTGGRCIKCRMGETFELSLRWGGVHGRFN